jgi:hypothetical protein
MMPDFSLDQERIIQQNTRELARLRALAAELVAALETAKRECYWGHKNYDICAEEQIDAMLKRARSGNRGAQDGGMMQTKFKLQKTDYSNYPVLDAERASDPYPYIWIGNDMPNDMRCYATLSGRATLRRLAHSILQALDATTKAVKCRAKGCTRKTRNAAGYCWQHADMAQYKREATK